MNLHVLKSQESKKLVFFVRRVHFIFYDGHWRRKYKRDEDEILNMRKEEDIDALLLGLVLIEE